METIILWCGFIGAWLLFAGPIMQAALELNEQEIERDRLHLIRQKITTPRHVSPWWWLLPPVKIFLEQRSDRQYKREFASLLEPEDLESLITFMNKARGWLFVAGGALLIAIKETYELAEHSDWPVWALGGTIIVLVVASLLNTVFMIKATHGVLEKYSDK